MSVTGVMQWYLLNCFTQVKWDSTQGFMFMYKGLNGVEDQGQKCIWLLFSCALGVFKTIGQYYVNIQLHDFLLTCIIKLISVLHF